MLTQNTLNKIRKEALVYWKKEFKKPELIQIAAGKEVGHKLADLVDEKTTALLTVNYLVAHQRNKNGDARARSMGDLWLQEKGIYHPVNVKTGVSGSEGQPNLVSLKKILDAVMKQQIDSYYILIVKMAIHSNTKTIAPSIYFFDMLDWLDYVTFDAGPGQMMLHAAKFYADFDADARKRLTIKQKLEKLVALYKDGDRRLRENRRRSLKQITDSFDVFMKTDGLSVTSETQKGLNLR